MNAVESFARVHDRPFSISTLPLPWVPVSSVRSGCAANAGDAAATASAIAHGPMRVACRHANCMPVVVLFRVGRPLDCVLTVDDSFVTNQDHRTGSLDAWMPIREEDWNGAW